MAKTNAFNSADICVAPSHSENFCMVVAEALAHRVPVIASTGTPWQGLEEHGCGLWVDNTPASLAAAVQTLRARPMGEMGSRGRAWMIRDFSWDSVAREMRDLYGRLIERK
jgi:glycosyltransferase involved in cell wall biosynthesis